MEFEWDESKRLSNIAKHDIDFMDARELFDGRPVVEFPSKHFGEARTLTTGLLGGRFIAVVWTRSKRAFRFISVRRARTDEIRVYRQRHGN